MSEELTDLRDRVSRLEGMLAVSMARPARVHPGARATPSAAAVRSRELIRDGVSK